MDREKNDCNAMCVSSRVTEWNAHGVIPVQYQISMNVDSVVAVYFVW